MKSALASNLAHFDIPSINSTYPVYDRAPSTAAGRGVAWGVVDLAFIVSYTAVGWCSRESAASGLVFLDTFSAACGCYAYPVARKPRISEAKCMVGVVAGSGTDGEGMG